MFEMCNTICYHSTGQVGALLAHIDDDVEEVVLVYNAAALIPGAPETLDAQTLGEHLQVNVGGALTSVNALTALIKEKDVKASILLTGGGLSTAPAAALTSLALGKAALRNFAFSLHDHLKPSNIHVCTFKVCGIVKPGTAFDPAMIAADYWDQHQANVGSGVKEVVFGPGAQPNTSAYYKGKSSL